jgi:hypothetical protein
VDGTAGRAAHVTVSGTALIRAALMVPMPEITDVGLDGTAGRATRAMFSVMDPIRTAILAPITDRLGPAAEGARLNDEQNDELVAGGLVKAEDPERVAGRIELRTCATQSAGINAAR